MKRDVPPELYTWLSEILRPDFDGDTIRPASERKSLQTLASTFYRADPNRKLRIGVDASIWLKQCTTSLAVAAHSSWPNLELQAFMYKLTGLFNAGVSVLLVFDGPLRPEIKRGKKVGGGSMPHERNVQSLAESFGFEWVKAPAEAEAELAALQLRGDIDLILSDDADTLVFGATWVMRNHSKGLTGTGAQTKHDKEKGFTDHEAFHTLYRAEQIETQLGLTHGGLILMALMSGGDYDQGGIINCGHNFSHAMAKCGFGDKLVDAYRRHRHQDLAAFTAFLDEWREDLKIELRTNASGYLTSRRKALADNIPNTFPELTMLDNYIEPITTITHPAGRKTFDWSKPFSMPKLVDFVTKKLDWDHCMIKSRFKSDRGIWAGLVLLELLSQNAKVAVKIARDRAHVSTGHEHEYRLEYDPSKFLITLDKCLDRHDPNEAKMAAHKAKSKDRSGVVEDEFSDEEPACPKKRGENKSVLWVHASVLRIASPQLVAEYEDLKQEKQEKKVQAEARKQAKARGEKLSPTRRKATTKAPKKVAAVVTPSESEVEEELRPVVPFNPTARPSNEQVSRSSPTLDDLFTSTKPRRPQTTATVKPKPSSSQSQCQAVASSSRASSVETIIDLCSSPEASIPLKAKKSHRPVLSDSSKGSDNVARIRKSPKKRQQQSPHSRSLLDDSEEELPELPDMLQLSQAATKRKSTAAQGGRLSFRSSKTTTSVTSRTGTKAASKSAADPPNRPAFKSKTIYIEVDDDD